ncbi:hypothetical protein Pmani_033269 [Petrolisthes manimaculis]|uniref:Uncharacterized protein n=1 Tax=Petrolisthes manimaculis TaxID=1843537 RepID=A0AAE1TQ85_9EUCA|nr:hypothetical protein Pmani_033269 [Petrolisthes manimaculis]
MHSVRAPYLYSNKKQPDKPTKTSLSASTPRHSSSALTSASSALQGAGATASACANPKALQSTTVFQDTQLQVYDETPLEYLNRRLAKNDSIMIRRSV